MFHFVIAIVLFAGTQQGQTVHIEADTQDSVEHVGHAVGHVVATDADMRVEADEATYDNDTNILIAEGHVKYTRGTEHLNADHLTLNTQTKEGDFTNVKGEVGPGMFITAQTAHRMEDGRYLLTNATMTTCDVCDDSGRPGWTFAQARAIVDPERRITSRGSVFRLEGIPVFYLPYVTVPSLNRTRSSGFLIPSTSTSTEKGRSLRESFYWAINRSADATFSGEYFTARGPAGAVEFRARPAENTRIQVDSLFAKDRLGDGGWSARILGFGDLSRGYRAVADMNLVSSILFRQVYEDGLTLISSPLEHSIAFLSRNEPGASVNFLAARNVVFFPDQPSVMMQKLPAMEISFPSRLLANLPVYFSADTSLDSIARRDAVINTPTFVERFDIHPSLEVPTLHSSLLDWSQRLSFQNTFYTNSIQSQGVSSDSINRFSMDYSSHMVGPQLQRDFGTWRHVIEPSVDYEYVNGADRFRNTLVVDDVDLVTNTNQVEYAITNRFFKKREIFSWRVAQTYFFDPTFGGAIIPGQRNVFAPVLDMSGFAFADGLRHFSPIVSTMRVSTSASTATDFQVDYDTRDHVFRSAGIIGSVSRGKVIGGIAYFFTNSSVIEVPNNELRSSLTYGNRTKPGFSAAFSVSYDIPHSLFQSLLAELRYNTKCLGLSLEVSQFNIGARVESRFLFSFTLKELGKNIGSIGTIRPQERLF